MNMLQQSRNQVLAQIQSACALAGREPDSVQLLAVSKTQPSPVLAEMYQAGQRAFGENYLQEALEKSRHSKTWILSGILSVMCSATRPNIWQKTLPGCMGWIV